MLTRKSFYLLVGICASIILLSSLETAVKVKDSVLFAEWAHLAFPDTTPGQEHFSLYVSSILTIYLFKLVVPSSIALTAFLVLNREGKLGVMSYIWVVLSIGGLAFHIVDRDIDSIFYYIGIVLYIILVLLIYLIALKRNYTASKGGEYDGKP